MPANLARSEYLESIDAIGSNVAALRYLGNLLATVAFYEPTALKNDGNSGLSHLVNRQLDDIEGHLDTLALAPSLLREDDLAPAAAATDAASTETEDTLDRLRHADLGQIARAVNLKEETVRRVVDRLLAEPDGHSSAVSNG